VRTTGQTLPITTRVVVVAQNKGSVGKSTISLCLIDLWLRLGLKIAAIDGDLDHNTLAYAYEDESQG
jgi:MinD-like ATPase involved in chromosome partitioning or flagellar assembly